MLSRFVQKTEGLNIALATTDALAGIKFLNQNTVDILLLDIEMPDIRGIELIGKLDHPPLIIFTTAYEEYALEGYDLDIVDYLLKPIPYDRFVKAIDRARTQYVLLNQTIEEDNSFITVTIDYKKVDIRYSDILYIEGLKDYVKIYTTDGMKLTRMSIKGFETIMDHPSFKRVHRSYIVNMDKVTARTKSTLYIEKLEIPLGKKYEIE